MKSNKSKHKFDILISLKYLMAMQHMFETQSKSKCILSNDNSKKKKKKKKYMISCVSISIDKRLNGLYRIHMFMHTYFYIRSVLKTTHTLLLVYSLFLFIPMQMFECIEYVYFVLHSKIDNV